jgi:hypothetical protein
LFGSLSRLSAFHVLCYFERWPRLAAAIRPVEQQATEHEKTEEFGIIRSIGLEEWLLDNQNNNLQDPRKK